MQHGLILRTIRYMHTSPVSTHAHAHTSSRYYNYTMSNDGQPEKHKDNYTLDYLTDRLKEQAVDFIHQSADGARDDSPIFMYIATPAPHRPATPAPQYANKFVGKPAPRTPSYGHAGTDKHWIISTGVCV